MEKVLLNTSLARMGVPQRTMDPLSENDIKKFNFGVANLLSTTPNPFKRLGSCRRWAKQYLHSNGVNYTLLLENECLKLPIK